MPARSFDIIIVGNGITALSAACSLKASSFEVAVISRPSSAIEFTQEENQRNFTIVESSRRFLDRLGVWKHVEESGIGKFGKIEVWDCGSKGYLEFETPLGFKKPMGWVVPESILLECLDFHGLEIPRFSDLESIKDKFGAPVEVKVANGDRLNCKLVVFADASYPKIRTDLGLSFKANNYSQSGIVTNIKTEKPHKNIARQWFSNNGVLAFLPKDSNSLSSMVFSVPEKKGNQILSYKTEELCSLLTEKSEAILGKVDVLAPPRAFPLTRGVADVWVKGRCVLAGSAAHEIHPLAGLGLNLNLMDVASLVECIGPLDSDENWPAARSLNNYYRWRKSESTALLMATETLLKFFTHPMFNSGKIKRALLKAFNQANFAKEKIVRQAMGLSGDLPAVVTPNKK